MASETGHLGVVKMLCHQGVDVNATNDANETALMKACEAGHYEIVRYLCSEEVDVHIVDRSGECALIKAIKSRSYDTLVAVMSRFTRFDLNCGPLGRKALKTAITCGTPCMVEYLLLAGASPTAIDSSGNMPIHDAAEVDNIQIVKTLIFHGSPVNVKNFRNKTPIQIAHSVGARDVVDVILELGVFGARQTKK